MSFEDKPQSGETNLLLKELAAQDLFRLSCDAVVISDDQDRIIDANPAALSLFGGVRNDLLGCCVTSLVVEPERLASHRGELWNKEGACDLEIEINGANGEPRTCQFTFTVQMDRKGSVLGFLILIHDLTEARRLKTELRSFKAAVEATQVGVTITNMNRSILYANPAEARMHGYQRVELIGMNAGLLGPQSDRRSMPSRVEEKNLSWKRQTTNVRRDGSTFPVQLYSDLLCDDDGVPCSVVTICEDISERRNTEEKLRLLSSAVENSPALVIITERGGRITYVNPQFERVTGYSREEVLGAFPSILKSGEMDASIYQEMWSTISAGGTWRGEFHNKKKDGAFYWATASITGVRGSDGMILSYIGVQEDTTQRKEMEQRLVSSNAELESLNRLKSDMVAVASHDLRSPLNAIIGLADLLRDERMASIPQKRQQLCDQIVASGHRMSSFIKDILDVEMIESGRLRITPKPTRLVTILEPCIEVARCAAREKDVSLVFETGRDLSDEVLADPLRLEQVFANIINNAVKFSPRGGAISIHILAQAETMCVEILDEGPGIPEEDLEGIFDRYFQVKKEGRVPARGYGVGLGLYIAHQIVTLHQGTIRARNRQAGGCCFEVCLSRCKNPALASNVEAGDL